MNTRQWHLDWFLVLNFSISLILASPHSQIARKTLPSSQLLETFGSSWATKRHKLQEPPQYMLDLYNEISESEGTSPASLPYGATVVRALPAVGEEESQNVVTFSLERIPEDEAILQAQFHIHYRQIDNKHRKLLGQHNLVKFKLFAIGTLGGRTLISSHMIEGHFGGWTNFKVGESVTGARDSGRITFELEAVTLNDKLIDMKIHHARHGINKPLLVLFNEAPNRTLLHEEFPDPTGEAAVRKRVSRSVTDDSSVSETRPSRAPTAGCELRDLLIDFEEIGWSSWIVFPTSYNAYQCSGKCAFPLGQDLHPTNHATVVSIVNYSSKENEWVSHPCCVPTTYKSLALLYYDEQDTVILKQFDRMIATQCGCR